MHILNRRRFFYAVFIAILIYINVADTTGTNAFVPQVSNKPILTIQQPINDNNLQEEDLMIQGMKINEYPVETVVATGYTAGAESTGKTPSHPAYGITYAGVPVTRDVYSTIAADLSTYPLGTILYIPGYGYGVVTDIGSAIQGNKIDLYYDTVEEVYNEWGKQTIDVYVVHIGDGSITEEVFNALNENGDTQVFNHK